MNGDMVVGSTVGVGGNKKSAHPKLTIIKQTKGVVETKLTIPNRFYFGT